MVAHIVGLGQSNEMGAQSTPVVSSGELGFGAYKFVRGIHTRSVSDAPASPERRSASDFSFTPLVAIVEDVWSGETPAVGITSQLTARLRSGAAKPESSPTHYLYSYPHTGGKHLAELDWRDYETHPSNPIPGPGGYHATFVDDIRRARVSAASAGFRYEVAAFHFTQGENEGSGYILPGAPWLVHALFVPAYKADLAAAYARWDADARAVSGQANPIPLFISQVNNYWAGQSQAQLANEDPHVHLVGPIYYVPSALNSRWLGATHGAVEHLSADGQRWRGEQAGKVMSRVLFEGADWRPLQPRSVRRTSPTSIVLDFDVPCPPIAFETDWLAKATNYGFEVTRGTEDLPGYDCIIKDVLITGPQQVTIHLDPRTSLADRELAIVTYGRIRTVGTTASPIVFARAGAPFAHGVAAAELLFEGDLTAQFAPLLVEGCFILRQEFEPPSLRFGVEGKGASIVIREVRLEGWHTVVRGEIQSIVGSLAAGAPCLIERDQLFGNLRDSDPARSVFCFSDQTYGKRQGLRYPLHNFCIMFSAPIEIEPDGGG